MAAALSPSEVRDRPDWRPSSPDAVELDLAALWREIAANETVSRAVMSNLVVVRPARPDAEAGDPAADDEIVEAVLQRHPARAILLRYAPDQARGFPFGLVRVTVRIFGEQSRRYGVEVIEGEAACADHSLSSIVRRLSQGGVPTSIWWTGDICTPMPPEAITTMSRQLLFDSASCQHLQAGLATAGAILSRTDAPDLVDLNWRRLAPLRHALIHAFRTVDIQAVQPSEVTIAHAPSDAALGWLLGGWLHAMLAWPRGQRPTIVATADVPPDSSRAPSPHVSCEITTKAALRATMMGGCIDVVSAGQPPFSTPIAHEKPGDAIADELSMLTQDAAFARTLAAVTDLLRS